MTAQKCAVSFLDEYRLNNFILDKLEILCYTLVTIKKEENKMSQYSSKTYIYIVPFSGYIEIPASSKEEAEKIFRERVFGKEQFPSSYSITYEQIQA